MLGQQEHSSHPVSHQQEKAEVKDSPLRSLGAPFWTVGMMWHGSKLAALCKAESKWDWLLAERSYSEAKLEDGLWIQNYGCETHQVYLG